MNLAGVRVTVMGLGRSGGGVGAVRFLTGRGARVTVTDLLDENDLADPLAEIADCPVEAYHLGAHVEADFLDTDLVVANPAVPPGNPFLDRHDGRTFPSRPRSFSFGDSTAAARLASPAATASRRLPP